MFLVAWGEVGGVLSRKPPSQDSLSWMPLGGSGSQTGADPGRCQAHSD